MQQALSHVGSRFARAPVVPYIALQGQINREMTQRVDNLLKKVPKRATKLAVVLSSPGGSFSQAAIIADKLRSKARESQIEIITFGEQFVLNSGFMVLLAGDKVFIDSTTVVGGLQNGDSKLDLGNFATYFSSVVYSQGNSYGAELKKDSEFDTTKAQQMQTIFSHFSEQAKERILKSRPSVVAGTDLTKLYSGQSAVQAGLVDGFGRIHQKILQLEPNADLKKLNEGRLGKFASDIRRLQFKK